MFNSRVLRSVVPVPQARQQQYRANAQKLDAVPLDDQTLVRQCLRGNVSAFAELVTRYTAPIYSLAYRLTDDRAEAENVTQETFLRAYAALPRSRTDLAFKPWLFQIAVNLCRDLARKKRPAAFSELSTEADPAPEEAIEDESPLPLDQVEERELRQALVRAVADLPEIYRAVVTLRYTEELSYEDIAMILQLPINTVRTHLFRAKAMLRKSLADWQRTGESL